MGGRVVKGLARREHCLRHAGTGKCVDASLFAQKSGYSPMTGPNYKDIGWSCPIRKTVAAITPESCDAPLAQRLSICPHTVPVWKKCHIIAVVFAGQKPLSLPFMARLHTMTTARANHVIGLRMLARIRSRHSCKDWKRDKSTNWTSAFADGGNEQDNVSFWHLQ